MTGVVGVIADDVTGGTDVAAAFSRHGLRTQLYFGTPTGTRSGEHDVIVIALKTRMIASQDAAAHSVRAARWLREHGATQLYVKYCSTFDSTPRGNIGPVLDAVADECGAHRVVQTPSSPEHGRTQYAGHLFVDDVPLSESPMRHHPLTPMTDSSLPRLLARQTAHSVGIVPHRVVAEGAAAISAELRDAARYVFVDALTDPDLLEIGRAVLDEPLVAGASGLAGGLASAIAERMHPEPFAALSETPTGRAVVLAGSCSRRTLEQITVLRGAGRPSHRLDPVAHPDRDLLARTALTWYDAQPDPGGALIYSSLPPAELRAVQDSLGVTGAAELLEGATALVARGLVDRGVRRLIGAGGETCGAIIGALGVTGGTIGAEPARGVPWIRVSGDLALLLKSGNFGDPDLLLTASRTGPS